MLPMVLYVYRKTKRIEQFAYFPWKQVGFSLKLTQIIGKLHIGS